MPGRCVRCRGAKAAHRPLTCLGGLKSGHPGGLVVAVVLGGVDGRVVGVDALGVAEGVGFEGVGSGEGEDGQDQLKNSRSQVSEQFTKKQRPPWVPL